MGLFGKGLGLGLLFFTTPVLAQSAKPTWVSVGDLVARYNDTKVYSYLSNAFYRCSAVNSLFGALLTRDGIELGSSISENSTTQLILGNMYTALQKNSLGAAIDINDAASDTSVLTSDMYQSMIKNYADWMNYNYVNFGDYTSEPDFANEIGVCTKITREMTETLSTPEDEEEPATQPESRGADLVENLARLQELHDSGVLDDEEFNAAKRALLELQ